MKEGQWQGATLMLVWWPVATDLSLRGQFTEKIIGMESQKKNSGGHYNIMASTEI